MHRMKPLVVVFIIISQVTTCFAAAEWPQTLESAVKNILEAHPNLTEPHQYQELSDIIRDYILFASQSGNSESSILSNHILLADVENKLIHLGLNPQEMTKLRDIIFNLNKSLKVAESNITDLYQIYLNPQAELPEVEFIKNMQFIFENIDNDKLKQRVQKIIADLQNNNLSLNLAKIATALSIIEYMDEEITKGSLSNSSTNFEAQTSNLTGSLSKHYMDSIANFKKSAFSLSARRAFNRSKIELKKLDAYGFKISKKSIDNILRRWSSLFLPAKTQSNQKRLNILKFYLQLTPVVAILSGALAVISPMVPYGFSYIAPRNDFIDVAVVYFISWYSLFWLMSETLIYSSRYKNNLFYNSTGKRFIKCVNDLSKL